MHDPKTVAFEIKYPWWGRRSALSPNGYRSPFMTIWHVDPETDRSDDSCGWFQPNLTREEIEKIEREVRFELKYWFEDVGDGTLHPRVCAEAVVYQAFQMIAWRVFRKTLKPKHIPDILSLTYNHIDNFADTFMGRWGPVRPDDVVRSCYFIARSFKRMERPWYRHPRWHVWHWQLQIHPWQQFKRWAFERCAKCKRGFRWNEGVVGSWHGDKIWHFHCDDSSKGGSVGVGSL